jgi:hypothetical protein
MHKPGGSGRRQPAHRSPGSSYGGELSRDGDLSGIISENSPATGNSPRISDGIVRFAGISGALEPESRVPCPATPAPARPGRVPVESRLVSVGLAPEAGALCPGFCEGKVPPPPGPGRQDAPNAPNAPVSGRDPPGARALSGTRRRSRPELTPPETHPPRRQGAQPTQSHPTASQALGRTNRKRLQEVTALNERTLEACAILGVWTTGG